MYIPCECYVLSGLRLADLNECNVSERNRSRIGSSSSSSSSSSDSSLLGDVVENHETLEPGRCAGQASNCALRDHKSPASRLQPPCSVRSVSNVRLMFVNDVPGAD